MFKMKSLKTVLFFGVLASCFGSVFAQQQSIVVLENEVEGVTKKVLIFNCGPFRYQGMSQTEGSGEFLEYFRQIELLSRLQGGLGNPVDLLIGVPRRDLRRREARSLPKYPSRRFFLKLECLARPREGLRSPKELGRFFFTCIDRRDGKSLHVADYIACRDRLPGAPDYDELERLAQEDLGTFFDWKQYIVQCQDRVTAVISWLGKFHQTFLKKPSMLDRIFDRTDLSIVAIAKKDGEETMQALLERIAYSARRRDRQRGLFNRRGQAASEYKTRDKKGRVIYCQRVHGAKTNAQIFLDSFYLEGLPSIVFYYEVLCSQLQTDVTVLFCRHKQANFVERCFIESGYKRTLKSKSDRFSALQFRRILSVVSGIADDYSPDRCEACGATTTQQCARCEISHFCNQDCLERGWNPIHHFYCRRMRRLRDENSDS